jgi:GAF domain-containing protein
VSDDGDLDRALGGLSQLLTGHRPLDDTLTRVAQFAVQAIPCAEGAGLTLLRGDRPQTVVCSADFVRTIDDIQYGIGEGPCVTAVAEGRTVVAGSLGGDPQWPRFGPRVGRMGVHSALSLPLLLDDKPIGALNVYARPKHAFQAAAVRLGELFAKPAAVSVHSAQLIADLQRTVTQLSDALTSRATIDRAVGLLMSRTGAGPDEAFDRLRQLSQQTNTKLVVVADRLVDEAVSRVRGRRKPHREAPDSSSADTHR